MLYLHIFFTVRHLACFELRLTVKLPLVAKMIKDTRVASCPDTYKGEKNWTYLPTLPSYLTAHVLPGMQSLSRSQQWHLVFGRGETSSLKKWTDAESQQTDLQSFDCKKRCLVKGESKVNLLITGSLSTTSKKPRRVIHWQVPG